MKKPEHHEKPITLPREARVDEESEASAGGIIPQGDVELGNLLRSLATKARMDEDRFNRLNRENIDLRKKIVTLADHITTVVGVAGNNRKMIGKINTSITGLEAVVADFHKKQVYSETAKRNLANLEVRVHQIEMKQAKQSPDLARIVGDLIGRGGLP